MNVYKHVAQLAIVSIQLHPANIMFVIIIFVQLMLHLIRHAMQPVQMMASVILNQLAMERQLGYVSRLAQEIAKYCGGNRNDTAPLCSFDNLCIDPTPDGGTYCSPSL